MNTERMKRHIYRSTPDRMVRHFDLLSDNLHYDQDEFLRWFKERMFVKHGNCRIDIYIDDMLAIHPSDVAIVITARPVKGRMSIVNTPSASRGGFGGA